MLARPVNHVYCLSCEVKTPPCACCSYNHGNGGKVLGPWWWRRGIMGSRLTLARRSLNVMFVLEHLLLKVYICNKFLTVCILPSSLHSMGFNPLLSLQSVSIYITCRSSVSTCAPASQASQPPSNGHFNGHYTFKIYVLCIIKFYIYYEKVYFILINLLIMY